MDDRGHSAVRGGCGGPLTVETDDSVALRQPLRHGVADQPTAACNDDELSCSFVLAIDQSPRNRAL
jgi:hypothetical protein